MTYWDTWHAKNLEHFATNEAQLAVCEKQIRRNQRLLHWWNPFRFMLQPEHENLLVQTERLRKADAELRRVDALEMAKSHV